MLLAAGGFAHNPRDARASSAATSPTRAKWSIANPGDTGEALQTAMRLGAQTDADGRGVVAAVAAHRPVRPVDARPGPPAAPHDLRRRGGQPVRQRVELLHGGRQGDVRARQDQPGRAVLADLRRPLPQALRAPALAARAASRGSCSRAAGSSRRGRSTTWRSMCGIDADGLAETVEHFNEHAAQRRRPRLRPRRVGLQPLARRPEPRRCTRASARSTSRRTTPCEVLPGDIGTCGGLRHRRARPGARSGRPSRSTASTPPATAPPR